MLAVRECAPDAWALRINDAIGGEWSDENDTVAYVECFLKGQSGIAELRKKFEQAREAAA